MTDLDKLIAAVEAGEKWDEAQYRVFGEGTENVTLYQDSFDGSLDAALRLHDALLPGWLFCISNSSAFVTKPDGPAIVPLDWDGDMGQYHADADNPARAWLLAILRALAAPPEGEKGVG